MSITIDDVKSKLLTLDQVRERLASTEPMSTYQFNVGTDVAFRLEEDYNHGITALKGDNTVNGFVTVNGHELQLTRDSLYEAASTFGLSKGVVNKLPSHLMANTLNYFFRGGLGEKEYKFLAVNDKAAALARGAVQPYSNLRLMEAMLNGIEAKYGFGQVYADYKFTHDLQRTHMRLIVPEYVRTIENTGTENDTWSTGLQLKNSLIGLEQTEIHGYLFRYWCTNGAIDTRSSANSVWSRRGERGRGDEVYEWAADAVDEVLGGLEGALDAVQAMTEISIEGTAVEALRDVFTAHRIPTAQRERILNNMVNEDNLTMYSLMQAITQAANVDDIDPVNIDRLLRAGGDLTVIANDRCDSCHRFMDHAH